MTSVQSVSRKEVSAIIREHEALWNAKDVSGISMLYDENARLWYPFRGRNRELGYERVGRADILAAFKGSKEFEITDIDYQILDIEENCPAPEDEHMPTTIAKAIIKWQCRYRVNAPGGFIIPYKEDDISKGYTGLHIGKTNAGIVQIYREGNV